MRIRDHVCLRGRDLRRHGLYRGLVPLSPEDALLLVENRLAKLPAETSLRELRAHIAASASICAWQSSAVITSNPAPAGASATG